MPEELVEREVKAICKRYRIAPEDAKHILNQHFQRRPDILKKILTKYPHEDITRLSAYKKIIKTVRKHIYYHLRQYQTDKQQIENLRQELEHFIHSSQDAHHIDRVIKELLFTHVSTKERAEYYPMFYRKVFEFLHPPRRILDIGCGIHPLSYPFEHPEYRPDLYVAVDKQPEVIETLRVFAPYVRPTHLIPICSDIAEANWISYAEKTVESFDIACMLKLIPVITTQQRNLLPKLASVPAHQILITAAMESMTRRENIRRKEERALRAFIEMTEREIVGTFHIENEFGYLLE